MVFYIASYAVSRSFGGKRQRTAQSDMLSARQLIVGASKTKRMTVHTTPVLL